MNTVVCLHVNLCVTAASVCTAMCEVASTSVCVAVCIRTAL